MMKAECILSIVLVGGLLINGVGCSRSSEESAPEQSFARNSDTGTAASIDEPDPDPIEPGEDEQSDTTQDEQSQSSAPSSASMCETISSADLTTITGIDYTTSQSTADFPMLKACEYFAQDVSYAASILVAFDSAAEQRMEQNRQVPGVLDVGSLGDAAIWEPAQGKLTVSKGNRCAVVYLSSAHGDDGVRQSLAAKIATLVFDRF